MIIGQGSYGEVSVRDGVAVKKFNKLAHLVQEFTALQYLRECPHVVAVKGVDFSRLELHMELFDASLRKWLEETRENGKVTHAEIMTILKDVLLGLVEMHDRNLAHGDLKPGNILLKRRPLRAVLGDCGFVSLAKYAKVERTAASYRDPIIFHDFQHDMFSFGVCFLELVGEVKINRQASYEELKRVVKDEVQDPRYREIIYSLVHQDRSKRPTSRDLLEKLFAVSVMHFRGASSTSPDPNLADKEMVRQSMKDNAGRYEINRGKRGYIALVAFLAETRVERKYYLLHVAVTLMILSAMFGKSGFTENEVSSVCGKNYSLKKICETLETVLSSDVFLNILLVP